MFKNEPLVSVIVPSFNHEKYIEQTLLSIFNQTYKNIELFVIDDGSEDRSNEIILKLQDKYNFYYETQSNKGVMPTLNKLLSLCNGKYIAMIASDDIWLLDKIEKQVFFMENNMNYEACFGNSLLIDKNSNLLPLKKQFLFKQQDVSFESILSFKHPLRALTGFYKKDTLKKLLPLDESCKIEDMYIYLEITNLKGKIFHMNTLLAFYRNHESNTSKKIKLLHHERIKLLKKYKGRKGYWLGLIRTLRYYLINFIYGK